MEYRQLGKTDLTVSALSFGTWAIGGSWGAVKDQEAGEGIARAVDLGVTLFDTADVYGDGHAEELLGAETRHLADRVAIATKFGRSGDWQAPANYQKSRKTPSFSYGDIRRSPSGEFLVFTH